MVSHNNCLIGKVDIREAGRLMIMIIAFPLGPKLTTDVISIPGISQRRTTS
jgi:hypothetical protein